MWPGDIVFGVSEPGDATPPDPVEPDPLDAGPGPAEEEPVTVRKGGPKLFLLLTCGFLTLLCCLGGVLVGGALGLARQQNLETVRDGLGTPEGWKVADTSNWPWSASATLTGPDDPDAVAAWLSGFGETGACPCEWTQGKFTVNVTVNGGSLELTVG